MSAPQKPRKRRPAPIPSPRKKDAPTGVFGARAGAGNGTPTLESRTLLKPFAFDGWGYKMPSLRVAERHAEQSDERATYFEKGEREAIANGNAAGAARLADLAKEERERANWWRDLADADAQAKRSYDEWRTVAGEHIDALLACGERDDGAEPSLALVVGQLHRGLHALAANGRVWAARLLVNSLGEAVHDFEMLATTKPQLFRERARGQIAIPGLISRNTEKQADNQRLLKQLEQGEDCPFAILPTGKKGRKWQFQDRANGLAVRLVNHIADARIVFDFHKLQAASAGRELPGWLHDAMKLQPFSATTWPAWAGIAWRVLAEISPEDKPELHPALHDPATKICNVRKSRKQPFPTIEGAYPVHDSRSIAEHDIKEAFFGAFELTATGVSLRTKQRRKGHPDK